MAETQDRRMADSFELELRKKAELDSHNAWELIWFLRLPLETRCSYMRILEARIDQDKTRQFLFRQSCYSQRDWRQTRLTREVHCMNVGVAQPWASNGRRQHRRKHDLRSSLRQRHTPNRQPHLRRVRFQFPAPRGFTSPVTMDPIAVPERPVTPFGLRDFIMSDETLTFDASGIDPHTGDRVCSYTPPIPSTPSAVPAPKPLSPSLPLATEPTPAHLVYPPGPLFRPAGRYKANGVPIDNNLAFIISVGQYHQAPWNSGEFPMADAVLDLARFDDINPGVSLILAEMLFPMGTDKPTHAIPAVSNVILDLIIGWLVLPDALANGRMVSPWQMCPCGDGVVMT